MIKVPLKDMGRRSREACLKLSQASRRQKDTVLETIARLLISQQAAILQANETDLSAASQTGLSEAMLDRLSLKGRLEGIAADLLNVARLQDPIEDMYDHQTLENGLQICKKRTPIGVLGIIYEARPNVTIDVAGLTIKTGNCAILRGGSETVNSNAALLSIIQQALQNAGLPPEAIQLVMDPDRRYVLEMLKLYEVIDLIIPRGGAGLHRYCRENSMIPVITGGIGICHLYVDLDADMPRALEVIFNAKTQRPTVCNALDTLLVHAGCASRFIPEVIRKLGRAGVSFRLDPQALRLLGSDQEASIEAAGPEDWDTEWLSLVLGIKVVQDLDEALDHIRRHSSGHSDGILTENHEHARKFVNDIDSAAVYINASTRFTDGSQLGLGAEVAISTQKLHARGPMGLKELTSYKWIVKGDYHIRK